MGQSTVARNGFVPNSPDLLACETCGKAGPAHMFHTENKCRSCHYLSQQESSLHASRNNARAAARDLLKSKVGIVNSPTAIDLAAAMMDKFGSMEMFAHEWYCNIQASALLSPGSPTALRAFSEVKNLIVAATPKKDDKVAAKALTDTEIEQELIGIIMAGIQSGKLDPHVLGEWAGSINAQESQEPQACIESDVVNGHVVESDEPEDNT